MNNVIYKVRGFAHRALVAATNVLIFQNLSHVRKPKQRDCVVASPDKNLPIFVDVPFEVHGSVNFREQTLFRGHGRLGRHGAKNEL